MRSDKGPRVLGLWIICLVIAVGAAVAAYLLQPDPIRVQRASVVIGPPTVVQDSVAETNVFLTNLEELVVSDAVVAQVAETVPDLSVEDYVEKVSVTRRGSSSYVEISFVHPDASIARATVETVVRYVLDSTARREFDRAAFLLESATERRDTAQAELEAFVSRVNIFAPETEYQRVVEELAANRRELTQATVEGATDEIEGADDEVIEILESRNEALTAERERLGEALVRYRGLSAELSRASEAAESARRELMEAEFEYRIVNTTENLIVSRDLEAFHDNTERLQLTALAAALALALAVATIVPLGYWLARRRERGRHENGVDEAGSQGPGEKSVDLTDVKVRVNERG